MELNLFSFFTGAIGTYAVIVITRLVKKYVYIGD